MLTRLGANVDELVDLPMPVYVIDRNGMIVWINDAGTGHRGGMARSRNLERARPFAARAVPSRIDVHRVGVASCELGAK